MKFLASDDKLMAKVNKIRDRIKEIDYELAELEAVRAPRDDIEQRIDSWIERTRERSGLNHHLVAALTRPNGGKLSSIDAYSYGGPNGSSFNLLGQFLEIQAFLDPDALKASLMAVADQELECHEAGPPLADRPEIRRKLEAERQKAELAEEKEIEKLEDAGWLIHRRPDARPEVILNEVTQ